MRKARAARARLRAPGRFVVFVAAATLFLSTPLSGQSEEVNDELFQEIVRQTEIIRGLKFKSEVPFRRLSKEALVKTLEEEIYAVYTEQEWDLIRRCYSALGIIPDNLVLDRFLVGLIGEQAAGLYDPHEKEMHVIGDLSLEMGLIRVVLEHELTHALTDQHFNLLGLALEKKDNDDLALAHLALVEGDATISMSEYARDLGAGDMVAALVVSLFVDQGVYSAAPPALQGWMLFPYLAGELFLLDIMGDYDINDGALTKREKRARSLNWRIADYAYLHPPESTEQILHPEKYHDEKDSPKPVNAAPACLSALGEGWEKIWENTAGEFMMKSVFLDKAGSFRAETASNGWGGDRYSLYRNPAGEYLFFWNTIWDSPRDAEEFRKIVVTIQEEQGWGGEAILAPSESGGDEVQLFIVHSPDVAAQLKRGMNL